MTGSAGLNQSNLGQPGSSPNNLANEPPMNPLTEPTHTRSQSLVKDTVKTGLTVDVSECRPELEASPHQRWLNVTQIPVPGGW
jgi:hypothetical protein